MDKIRKKKRLRRKESKVFSCSGFGWLTPSLIGVEENLRVYGHFYATDVNIV